MMTAIMKTDKPVERTSQTAAEVSRVIAATRLDCCEWDGTLAAGTRIRRHDDDRHGSVMRCWRYRGSAEVFALIDWEPTDADDSRLGSVQLASLIAATA